MEKMMRVAARSVGVAGLSLVLVWGRTGVAFQRNPQPTTPSPNYPTPGNTNNSSLSGRTASIDDQSTMRELEEKHGKALNSERQRMMMKEAAQLVQTAADLEASVMKGIDGAEREQQAKRAEAIEKLAKSVKERMKGNR